MTLDDENALLTTFAPIVYLSSDEASMPASIEWTLAHSRLCNGQGTTVLPLVGSVANLMAAGADATWSLELIDEASRAGDGPDAPVYGTVRPVTQAGVVVAYDLEYWFYYPFNGNIFDLESAKAIIGTVVAMGTVACFWFPPYGFTVLAAAAAALHYLNSVEGVQMHESDWESITVRVDDQSNILGVFYSAHGSEVGWLYQEAPQGAGSMDSYTLQGRRPIVYAACESHAHYPYAGETERLGGFANDETDGGLVWDPLDSANKENPMGRLVNIGHDIDNPPAGQEWIQYPGLWGRYGGGGGVYVEWFGSDLQEYADGKTGPAQRGSWTNGEPAAPTNWSSAATALSLAPSGAAFTIAEYFGFLCAVYAQPDQRGSVSCAVYNGRNWSQPPVAGLTVLGDAAAISMQAFQGVLHTFFRVATDLEWAQLIIADDGATAGWVYESMPPPLSNPPATGDVATAVLGDTLYVLFENAGALRFLSYDGQVWTDVSRYYPFPSSSAAADGPIALASYSGALYAAFACGGALQQAEFSPGVGWAITTPPAPVRSTGACGVCMEAFGGYLYLTYADANGSLHWTRRTAAGGWMLSESGGDFDVPGAAASGRIGLAVNPDPQFLALVYPSDAPTPGTLYLTDMLSG